MMSRLVYLVPLVPAFIIAVIVCLPWARPTRPFWLFACLSYILLDGAVTLAGLHLLLGRQWNWVGKAFSVALACLVILILRPQGEELPLGLPADRSRWAWTLLGIVAACLFAGVISFVVRNHTGPSPETIAYEATMPGLAEELCWRGIVFVLLGRAYSQTTGGPNLFPAALCATVLFGLCHGFSIDNGLFRFACLPFVFATIFGTGLAFLRLRVKSLPTLVATHNIANVCSDLVNGLA